MTRRPRPLVPPAFLLLPLGLAWGAPAVVAEPADEGAVQDEPLGSLPEVDAALREAEAAIAAIVAVPDGERTFENTVLAIDDLYARLEEATNMLTFMALVSPDAELRERGDRAQQEVEAWAIGAGKREDLYRAVRAWADAAPPLEGEEARLVEFTLRDYRRAGMDLSPEDRAELTGAELELAKLEQEFERNIREEDEVVLLTADELAGMPDDWFEGVESSNGVWFVTLDNPTYRPITQLCEVAATRHKTYLARQRRAGRNVGLIEEILALRARQAELLGYAHPADFETEIRMSGSAAAVEAFYADLRDDLRVKAELDLVEYRAAKREHTGDAEARLDAWDQSFYHDRLLKQEYRVDPEQVKQYFPLAAVIEGLFGITQALYGLEYREITDAAREAGRPMWHEDARLFEVRDEGTGELLGEFYIDLHPRPNKYNHAAQFALRLRKRWSDGSLQKPLVALVCNFSKPTAEAPALLRHAEVETFFHEFGHCLHSLLTRAEIARFAGTRVARDFVEAPSQMFENWVWDADVLRGFARHHATGEPLPEELLAGMLAARNLGSGMRAQGQVYLGALDLAFHTAPDGAVDTRAVCAEVYERETLFEHQPGTYFHAAFGHLVGYQAGYYGYLWSEVFAQDMFGRFRELGLLSPEAGRVYRDGILAPGGTRDAMELLVEFLGREPRPDAFLEHLGLVAGAEPGPEPDGGGSDS